MRGPCVSTVALLCVGAFVRLASAVAGQPDLSGVEHLSRSDDYRVWISGEERFVFKSHKTGNHGSHDITSMSFLSFDLGDKVNVRVKPRKRVDSFEVRPFNAGIEATLEDNVISFKLDRPRHVVVVVNGSYNPVLVVSAKPPQQPPPSDSVTHYFEPGVHDVGKHMPLKSGDNVYIAEGAIVQGGFSMQGATNVTIRGRGIVYTGNYPHEEAFRVFKGDATANVLIEGITVTHAPGWIVSFWGGNRNLTVRDVTMVGNWFMNSDGVQTGTDGLLVENCFMQCNDDNFSLNGICKNVVIRNNVVWNLFNGGVFMLGWATGEHFELENLDIHDNVIFRAGGCCHYDRKGPFSMKLYGWSRSAKNIRFRNIVIEDLVAYGRWVDFQAAKANRSAVSDIAFENIDLRKAWKVEGELRGNAESCPIENVIFTNCTLAGELMTTPTIGGLNLVSTKGVVIQGQPVEDIIAAQADPEQTASVSPGQQQPASPAVTPSEPNLLSNGSFERGLAGWDDPANDISLDTASPADGSYVARAVVTSGNGLHLAMEITDILEQEGPGTYAYAVRVRAKSTPIRVKTTIVIEDENGVRQHPSPDVLARSDDWTQAMRQNAFNWQGLKKAWLRVDTVPGDKGTLFIDDCHVSK